MHLIHKTHNPCTLHALDENKKTPIREGTKKTNQQKSVLNSFDVESVTEKESPHRLQEPAANSM